MSRRARQPQQQQGQTEDDAAAVTSLTVVKSCSDTKEIIQVPLSTTLGAFKELLSRHARLGNKTTPLSSIRLFYLGRELKTNGRTLAGLGVGRMGVNVLHMHSACLTATNKANKPPEIAIDDDDDDDPIEVVEPQPHQRQQRAAASTTSSSHKHGQQQQQHPARATSSSSESSKRGVCVDLSADNEEGGRSKRRR